MAYRLSTSERALLTAFARRLEVAAPGAVVGLRVFGSRARGDSDERSDLDLAVEPAPDADRRRLRQVVFDIAYDTMAELHLEGLRLAPVVLPMDGQGLAAIVEREGRRIAPPEFG